MRNSTTYESLPKTSSPATVKKFVNHNSEGRVHFHEEIEILYFTEGMGRVICNMKEFKVGAGDIVFSNGNELHAGCFDERGSVYYCIQLKTDFFNNFIGGEYVSYENLIKSEYARELLDKVISEDKKGGYKSAIEINKTLYELFSYLSVNFAHSVLSAQEYKKRFKRLDTFNSVIEYIDAHYYENISVDFIASRFYISTSYFSHLFKKRAKKSLVEYLNETRIRHAKAILENETLSVGEIALKVGFSDINYFSRIFKREVGMTPTEFRRAFKNG